MSKRLEEIISSYQRAKSQDSWIEHCQSLTNLDDAIRSAALAKDGRGKIHGHQRRIKNPETTLGIFSDRLISRKGEIKEASSFEALMRIVEDCRVPGVGQVCCYDTANRIGAHLGLRPERIYLHAGSRVGAQKLIGSAIPSRSIALHELPGALQNSSLSPAEIEDLLCVYKNQLGPDQSEVRDSKCKSVAGQETLAACCAA